MNNTKQMRDIAPWTYTGYADGVLMIDASIALHGQDWRCTFHLVGELDGMRWYHNCTEEKGHDGPHEAGCGQTWWWENGLCYTRGPLTDIALDNRRDFPAGVPMSRFGLDEFGPERVVYVDAEQKVA